MHSDEAEVTYLQFIHEAKKAHPVALTNQVTPYESWTLDDLFREFGSSDKPETIELIRRCALIHYQEVAFCALYDSIEDRDTVDELSELVEEHQTTIRQQAAELETMKKALSRAQLRVGLCKKELASVKKQLSYETRSVDKLETRTRKRRLTV